jgi:hypothetical protein
MIIDPKTIDFTRFKRIFAFGCSFTNYKWSTWADLLAHEMPQAEFINAGQTGAGNLYIMNQISQHNAKYHFTDTDLVLVMWSTFMREDKYLKLCWKTPGNIYTQAEYPEEYVKAYADPRGYLIRDLAFIDMTTEFLKNSPAHVINLMSVPVSYQAEGDCKDVFDLYANLLTTFPQTLVDYMGGQWQHGHAYYYPENPALGPGKLYNDYHPNTQQYCAYLKSIGIPVSTELENYARDFKLKCDTYTEDKQFHHKHPIQIL